jgi:asparagine synthetase B (glutamine-hydrolysing)
MPYADETFYTAVKRVPQGHEWRFDHSGAEVLRRFWDPRLEADRSGDPDPVDLEEFVEVFSRAVRRRLPGSPAAVYLSGGVDSIAVAAFAATELTEAGGPLALSLAVPGEEEIPGDTQRRVATELGLEQVLLPLEDPGEDGILTAALRLAAGWPTPYLDTWRAGFLRLDAEAARRGRLTVLTGNFGDEWQAVPFLAADLIATLRFRRLAGLAAEQRRFTGKTRRDTARTILWTYGVRALAVARLQSSLERTAKPLLRRRLEHILPAWLAPDSLLRRELLDRPTLLESHAHRTVSLRASSKTYDHPFHDSGMEELFEAGRRAGLTMGHPFCDADLLALRYRIRPEDLDRDGRSKYLIREAIERFSPDLAPPARRAPYHFFPQLVFAEAAQLHRQLGPPAALGALGVVDPQGFTADFERVVSNRDTRRVDMIWDVLSTESWLRTHN